MPSDGPFPPRRLTNRNETRGNDQPQKGRSSPPLPFPPNTNQMMASTLQKVLDAAFKERDQFRDQYVSIEHLVLALATQDTRFFKPTLTKQGVTEQQLREAVAAIRGNNLVTTRTPEAAYEVGGWGGDWVGFECCFWVVLRQWGSGECLVVRCGLGMCLPLVTGG